MRFSRKPRDPQRSNGMPVSEQWNAWQENAGATVVPPAEAKVIWHTLRKRRVQDRVMQSRFVFVDKSKGKNTAEKLLDTKASACIVVLGYADPDVLDMRRDSPTACREAINVLLAISASKGRDKWALLTTVVQAAFLKREYQDKDRVMYCWPPKNGPGLQPGSLLLILKGVLGLSDAPRKLWEKISQKNSSKSGLRSSECVLACLRCTRLLVY